MQLILCLQKSIGELQSLGCSTSSPALGLQQCWAHHGLGLKSQDVAHMRRAFSVSMSSTKERALRCCSLDHCPVTRLHVWQWDIWWYKLMVSAVFQKHPWSEHAATSALKLDAPTCLNVLTPSPYVPASGSPREWNKLWAWCSNMRLSHHSDPTK